MPRLPLHAVTLLLLLSAAASRASTTVLQGDSLIAGGADRTCFIMVTDSGDTTVINPQRCCEAFLPASTFKIINSLIALESGVVASVDDSIAWDGVDRGWDMWNRDHSIRTALPVSAVWFYQELARRIGPERMAGKVRAADYGNRNTGGRIDTFWLEGQLRITALEQVQFLGRMLEGDVPFQRAHVDSVARVMLLDEGEGWSLHGKTGWAVRTDPDVAWFVGFVRRPGETVRFALNMDGGRGQRRLSALAKAEAIRLLRERGVIGE